MAYQHPSKWQINNLHAAMDYNSAGQPIIRTLQTAADARTNPSSDSFGRLRVAQPFTLFDSQLLYDDRSDLYDIQTAGQATTEYLVNESSVKLVTTSLLGSRVTRQSKRVFAYQPGKSLQIMMSFCLGESKPGLAQRVGFFDGQNGIYFTNISGINYIVKRSFVTGSVVEEIVPQSEWNINPLDGNDPNGVIFDYTKVQILTIDIQWLGVGQVRVGFMQSGNMIFVHAFEHANSLQSAYMTTAILPVRYEIENLTNTISASHMKQICATVISEGGYANSGPLRFVDNGTSGRVMQTAGTFYTFLSIRINPARPNSIVILRQLSMLILSNQNVLFKILLNSNLDINGIPVTNANWVTHSDQSVQYIKHPVGHSFTGGEEIAGGWLSTDSGTAQLDNQNLFAFQLGKFIDGRTDTITIVAAPTSNNVTASALLGWNTL